MKIIGKLFSNKINKRKAHKCGSVGSVRREEEFLGSDNYEEEMFGDVEEVFVGDLKEKT